MKTTFFTNVARTALAFMLLALFAITLSRPALAQYNDQNDQDDPPGRVARLGYLEGTVSFQPAGEDDWAQAFANRPLTVDDKLWADRNSRAEVGLGNVSIYLGGNTGISFLNLDDRTTQIQLSAGTIDLRVRNLDRDEVLEIDTANQAFNISRPGRYRIEASDNGDYTVITVREGDGESSGNGQSYTVHAGQRATFTGTSQLNAELQQIDQPDDFDNWSDGRARRYEGSRSSQYVSRDMVGYEDLDSSGDWQAQAEYGHVWFPRVAAGWAPYRDGHWAWIDPWGWTWVDDAPWGYAPFHYGRWISAGGRWGWIPGPVSVRPVYAPALVVFVGGGFGGGVNVAWFPLGPREVFVPAYHVSPGYVNRVNISNTTVNQTTITNVYNTTIVKNNTTITNVTYVNRNVNGAVTAVPQRTFATAQPVARAAVAVNPREVASASVGTRPAVAPGREAVMGPHNNSAGRVSAPPAAVVNRTVIARTQPAPRAPSFAARQKALDANPGQPVARAEMQKLRAANTPPAQPQVKIVKATQPSAPPAARPGNQPPQPAGNQPGARPGNQPAGNERPGVNANPPGNPPNSQPAGNQPNRPDANRPEPTQPGNRPDANRPEPNRPNAQPGDKQPDANRPQPNQPGNRPDANRPDANRPNAQPGDKQPDMNRPQPNQPGNRPDANRPEPNRPNAQPGDKQPDMNRPQPNQPGNRPDANRPEPNRPNAQPGDKQPDANRPQPDQPDNPSAPNRRPPNRPDATPQPNRAEPNQPDSKRLDRPEANRPEPNRPQANRPDSTPPNREANRPPVDRPDPAARPDANRPRTDRPNAQTPAKPLTPEQKRQQDAQRKREEEQRKRDEKQSPQ